MQWLTSERDITAVEVVWRVRGLGTYIRKRSPHSSWLWKPTGLTSGRAWGLILMGVMAYEPWWMLRSNESVTQLRDTDLGETITLYQTAIKPSLCPWKRYYLITQECLLQTQPWEMTPVKNSQGLIFLASEIYEAAIHGGAPPNWWTILTVQLEGIIFTLAPEIWT